MRPFPPPRQGRGTDIQGRAVHQSAFHFSTISPTRTSRLLIEACWQHWHANLANLPSSALARGFERKQIAGIALRNRASYETRASIATRTRHPSCRKTHYCRRISKPHSDSFSCRDQASKNGIEKFFWCGQDYSPVGNACSISALGFVNQQNANAISQKQIKNREQEAVIRFSNKDIDVRSCLHQAICRMLLPIERLLEINPWKKKHRQPVLCRHC